LQTARIALAGHKARHDTHLSIRCGFLHWGFAVCPYFNACAGAPGGRWSARPAWLREGRRRLLNAAPCSFAHADPSWLNRIGAATTTSAARI